MASLFGVLTRRMHKDTQGVGYCSTVYSLALFTSLLLHLLLPCSVCVAKGPRCKAWPPCLRIIKLNAIRSRSFANRVRIFSRHAHYPPHRHGGLTTHLILSGDFTVCYPEDAPDKKETFGPGARIDVPAGKVHEVWMGKEGCTYVIGE